MVFVGFNLELHSTWGNINKTLMLSWAANISQSFLWCLDVGVKLTTASTAGDVSPTTSSAGHLQGKRTLEFSRPKIPAMTLIRIRTYISVLTVSSFRPTTGLSIPRSRRLVGEEKHTTQIIETAPFSLVCNINGHIWHQNTILNERKSSRDGRNLLSYYW